MKRSVAALMCLLLLAALTACGETAPSTSATRTGLWYEDNNMASSGGAPADFSSKFLHPDDWANARKVLDVYYVRSNLLKADASDDFLRNHFIPVLAESHIKLALDTGSATYLNSNYAANISAVNSDMALIDRIRRDGGRVDYIGLQSTLSKPLLRQGKTSDYPMSDRIMDVVDYATVLKKHFPDIKIGLIDALPTKGQDYQGPYHDLVQALSAAGLSLDFVHLDSQYELAQKGTTTSWAKIKQVQTYVKDQLHVHFGLVATSRSAGYTSDKAYNDAVVDVPVEYSKVGGYPDEYVIMSWYPHPALTVPDSAGSGQYPAMKTVRSFAQRIGR